MWLTFNLVIQAYLVQCSFSPAQNRALTHCQRLLVEGDDCPTLPPPGPHLWKHESLTESERDKQGDNGMVRIAAQ